MEHGTAQEQQLPSSISILSVAERNVESKALLTSCIKSGQQANQMLTNLEIKVVLIIKVKDSIKHDLKLMEYHLHGNTAIIKKPFIPFYPD
jgi:hypothetical protein